MKIKSRWLRRLFISAFAIVASITVVVVTLIVFVESQLPNVAVLKDVHLQVPLRVYSKDGLLIDEFGTGRRIPVSFDEVPRLLVQAILATEDKRFYSHPGVDLIGLFRATTVLIGTGQKSQGASTITMQVARNFFLTHKKTYIRKIREILLALKIERNFSKEKILELYLNKVYFGNRAYGVAAAANVYYGKHLNQLTLAEMAMIAGLPQAPSRNNPLVRPREALVRRDHVLMRLLETDDISSDQYNQAIADPDQASYHGPRIELSAPYVGEMARQFMVRQYGERVYDQGLSVYTTVVGALQEAATSALKNGLLDYTERHGYIPSGELLARDSSQWFENWRKQLQKMTLNTTLVQPAAVLVAERSNIQALLANGESISVSLHHSATLQIGEIIWVRSQGDSWKLVGLPSIQGALVAMNPQNGALLALVGGFDYELSEFNRVTQAQRQSGSAFKPFIYATALAKGFTLASTINDAPVVVKDPGENAFWRPRNDTRQFYGLTRLRDGLTHSRNIVTIRLLEAMGVSSSVKYLTRFGFTADQLPHSLSLALGTGLASPMKIAVGYSVFANGGYRVTPYFIDHIVDENRHSVFASQPQTPAEAAIDPQDAYLMAEALKDVIANGTGRAARVLKRADLAGKTGTTNDQVDAWFVGFNSQLVTSVWVGFDDLSPTKEYGSQAALPIWIDFMGQALAGTPPGILSQPVGIVTARIDPKTGLLAKPDQTDSIFEVFREGTEPKNYASADTQDDVEDLF